MLLNKQYPVPEINGRGVWNIGKGTNIQIGFKKVSPKGRDHLEEQWTDGRIRVHWAVKKLEATLRDELNT